MDKKIQEATQFYADNGYAIIEDFLSQDEVKELQNEVRRYIDKHFEQDDLKSQPIRVMRHGGNNLTPYYLDTVTKAEIVYEDKALQEKDWDNFSNERRERFFSRLGLCLHVLSKPFNRFLTSEKVRKVFSALGCKDPVAPYGAVILKYGENGGEHEVHQDCMSLYTEPCEPVIGIWIALVDATEQNGCLQFLPGSHKSPVLNKLEYYQSSNEFAGSGIDYSDTQCEDNYVKVPAKAGSLILIHGQVYHQSKPNNSNNPRWAFVTHCFDASRVKWAANGIIDSKTALQLHLNTKVVD